MVATRLDDHAARRVVDLVTGTWRAQALHAAAALRIPDHIAAGHTGLTELAERTGATRDGIERLMRLLVAVGVFAGGPAGYRQTEVSELLRSGVPGSMLDMVRLYGEEFHHAWGSFLSSVVTGRPAFEDVFGRPLTEYLAASPSTSAKFHRAMRAGELFFADVPKVFDFSSCTTVVDVAGGSGALLAAVLAANPTVRGLLVDLPHAVPMANEHLSAAFPRHRFDVVVADVFAGVPWGADAYLVSRVLQDWDDKACVRLLSQCRAAMADGARLLVLERVVPPDDAVGAADELSLLWDLHLLTVAGGRQRSLDDYRRLLEDAGLCLATEHAMPLGMTLLVATRR